MNGEVSRAPTVSTIVVNHNRRELLNACLRSLEQQTGDIDFEVIVVDNGSADGSAEMVETTPWRVPVRLLRNSDNRGFCAANNQGVGATSEGTRFIALLNNDAEASPDWLSALVAAFGRREDVGMAASKILVWEEPSRIDKAGHVIYLDGQNRGRGSGQVDVGQYDKVQEALWPDGCAAMYRRDMLERIGGFDEDFFAYGDDAELGLRGRIAGWECVYTPHAVVRHHRGATLGLTSMRRIELIERNRVLLAVKLFPWSLLWLNPFFYVARLAAGAWAGLRGQGEVSYFNGVRGKLALMMAVIRGDLAALRLAPRMLRKRAEVNRIRKLTPRQVKRLLLRYRVGLRELMGQAV